MLRTQDFATARDLKLRKHSTQIRSLLRRVNSATMVSSLPMQGAGNTAISIHRSTHTDQLRNSQLSRWCLASLPQFAVRSASSFAFLIFHALQSCRIAVHTSRCSLDQPVSAEPNNSLHQTAPAPSQAHAACNRFQHPLTQNGKISYHGFTGRGKQAARPCSALAALLVSSGVRPRRI